MIKRVLIDIQDQINYLEQNPWSKARILRLRHLRRLHSQLRNYNE